METDLDAPFEQIKSSFVRQHLSNVDFVRQETANQLQGLVSGQLHMIDSFVKELEVVIGVGVTVNGQTGQKVITPAEIKEGLGEDRFNEIVQIAKMFRGNLIRLGYSETPMVNNFFLGAEEPVAFGQPFEVDKPGIGKSKSVTLAPTPQQPK